MLHTKYQGFVSSGFRKDFFLYTCIYIIQINVIHVAPGIELLFEQTLKKSI